MRWWIWLTIVGAVLLAVAGVNLSQQLLVTTFNTLGWKELAGLASGRWWENIPIWVLATGVVVAIWQIGEARKSTNAQIAIQLFDKLRHKETKDQLSFIYKHLNREKILALSDESKLGQSEERTRDRIDELFDKFELLGTLVKQGIVNETLAMEAFAGTSALRLWHQSVLYIKEERKKRGFFLQNYEFFTQRAYMHFRDNGIPILFRYNGIPIDLVKEFQKEDYQHPPGSLDKIIKQESEQGNNQNKGEA